MSKKNTYLEKQKTQKQEKTQKRVAYYQTFLAAWVQNRMEFDKQLLILSTAGLGFVTFFREDLKQRPEQILWFFSGGLFIITIILILITFRTSSNHIRCFLDEDNEDIVKEANFNATLKKLGNWSRYTFISAVLATFALAMLSVFMVTIYELIGMACKYIPVL